MARRPMQLNRLKDSPVRTTKIVTRLTEHDDVIKSLLRGAPRLGLALGPALVGRACVEQYP